MRVISGSARSVPLKALEGLATRPTADRVKEALFSIIQFQIEGRRVLDLFGGSGQLAIEALSRGAAGAVIVDRSREALAVIRENLRRTRLSEKARVVQADYLDYLQSCRERFDLVFLDPPYAEKFLEIALKKISEIDILNSGGIIVCERPAEKTLSAEYPGFSRSRDYRYGKTAISVFRKEASDPQLSTGGITI